MSNSSTCRVCLLSGSNERFHSFRNTPLQIFFEKFTNLKLNTKDGKPEILCYICRWQIHCCRTLQRKAEKSDRILTQLIKHDITISEETITVLNREIVQQYSTSPVECNSYWPTYDALVKEEKQADEVDENEEVDEAEEARDIVGKSEVPPCEETVCRVCLNTRHKTRAIKNTMLQGIYEKLANTKLTTEENIPDRVCYICIIQLWKLHKLIDQAKKSDTILNELTRNGIQLTPSSYYILNRRVRLKLSTNGTEIHSFKSERSIGLNDHMVPFVRLERITLPVKRVPQLERDASNDKSSSEESEYNIPSKRKKSAQNTKNIFSCQLCDYRCPSNDTMRNHQVYHDQNREFSCNICQYRFGAVENLQRHMRNRHDTKHKCSECGEKFSTRRQIRSHMFLHYKGNTYRCEICDKLYTSKARLRHHHYMCHPEEKRTCEYCPIKFMGMQLLRLHILMIHAGQFPYYICDICKKQFHDKANIRKHIIHVHNDKVKFTCDYCGKSFGSKNTLKVHLRIHIGKPFKCPDCPRSYCAQAGLVQHMTKHTGVRPYVCEICKKCYRDKHGLRTHIKTHKGEKPHVCKVCLKAYVSLNNLNYHTMTVHGQAEKTVVCEICDMKFYRKEGLMSHMKTHEKRPDNRPHLPCGICHKVLRTNKGLDAHLKSHAGLFAYNCYKCNRSFNNKGNFRNHVKRHYGLVEKKYICNVCDKRYRTKYHLEIHIRSHTKEKPYSCDLCDKSFSQGGALKLHMRSHTGEKPYICDICDKKFNEKRSLDVHTLLNHTDKKQLICDTCNKVYTSKDIFIKHIKKHDSKTPHTCYKCENSFRNLKTLSEHVKNHPKICSICDKSFALKLSLRRHYLSIHGEYYSIACNICEKGFHVEEIEGLKRHMRLHRGEKPYVCDVCNSKYTKGSGLRKHKRIYHT